MKFAFLLTLDAVLKRGSFAKAGDEVGLTASAVSLQIKQLEDFFGQPLFDRSSRTAQPTAFAREVVATTQAAMASIEALRVKRPTAIAGRVALGTIRSVQTTTLPSALRLVRERFPELNIRLAQDDSPDLLHQLNAGVLDAAVVVRPASGGSSRLEWRNLATEPFVLVAPPDSTGNSPAELLGTHEWIRFDMSLTGGRIASSFVHKFVARPRGTMELASIDAIVALVSTGLGVSIVPRPRGPLLSAYPVREIDLGPHAPERQIAFVCRRADRDNRRVGAVRAAFEAVYGTARGGRERGGAARSPRGR